MAKIVVRVSTVCGALPVEGAKIYINGVPRGLSGKNGYSDVFEVDADSCTVEVGAEGYEKYLSCRIKLYENATVVWSAMIESQIRSKN